MNTFFYKDIAYPDGVIGGKDYYNPVIYSTTERVIGVWADNKPLYQKTVVFGSVSGTAASLPLNIANVDKIFLCADASSVNGIIPLSYVTGSYYDNNIGGFFDVAANNTNFEIRIGTAMAGHIDSVIITAQYTKTTDTAGSAPYNNNGVPTVRYSTDEQIIGLWADGKPLYEKTFTGLSQATNGADWVTVQGVNIPSIKDLINTTAWASGGGGEQIKMALAECSAVSDGVRVTVISSAWNRTINKMTVQYTKTTD